MNKIVVGLLIVVIVIIVITISSGKPVVNTPTVTPVVNTPIVNTPVVNTPVVNTPVSTTQPVNIPVVNTTVVPPVQSVPQSCNYDFTQGYDSNLGDIGNFPGDIPSLKTLCDSRPDCLGFNTNGWVKNVLLPKSQWNYWSSDPNQGFYNKSDPSCHT